MKAPRPAPSLSFVYMMTAFSAIGGFLFGYDTGVISGAMLLIAPALHLSPDQQETVVSAAIAGAIGGAAFAGWANQAFGRRRTIMCECLVPMGLVVA
jgi:SP family myo-inositol transporter-like MFS transporter 13